MFKNEKRSIFADVVFGGSVATIALGSLPPNSRVTGIEVLTSVAFDSGTSDLIAVGIASDVNKYADLIDVSSTGSASLTLTNVGAVEDENNSTELIATYTPTGTAATAGATVVIVTFVQN